MWLWRRLCLSEVARAEAPAVPPQTQLVFVTEGRGLRAEGSASLPSQGTISSKRQPPPAVIMFPAFLLSPFPSALPEAGRAPPWRHVARGSFRPPF